MIEFLDGPAAGESMQLAQAPQLLRVVQSPSGIFDALDLVSDEATLAERIYVYRKDERAMTGVLCSRGARPGNRCSPIAAYRLLEEQPADEHVRTTAAWQRWVRGRDQR